MQAKLLGFLLLGLAAPLAGQEARPPRWTLAVTAGPAVGGPSGELTSRFLAEGWTEVGCTPKGTDCHPNPVRSRTTLQLSVALARQFSRRLDIQGIITMGSLGRAEGRRNGYDVTGQWSNATLGAVLAIRPFQGFRLGAGPLLGMLNSETPGSIPNSVIRAGMLFVSEVRSSSRKPIYLNLLTSYQLLGKRREGPWPARKGTWFGEQGPSSFDVNYSHLTIGLGIGANF